MPSVRVDPGASTRLQVLATEHWSLLATRALTYSEALTRVTIFLAILSGAMIALALAALAIAVPSPGVWIAAAAVFVLALVLMQIWGRRGVKRLPPSLEPRFPSPPSP